MILKDIVQNHTYDFIEVREYININGSYKDVLVGFCAYINGELKSLDNDTYYLSDSVLKSLENKDGSLTIWLETEDEHGD